MIRAGNTLLRSIKAVNVALATTVVPVLQVGQQRKAGLKSTNGEAHTGTGTMTGAQVQARAITKREMRTLREIEAKESVQALDQVHQLARVREVHRPGQMPQAIEAPKAKESQKESIDAQSTAGMRLRPPRQRRSRRHSNGLWNLVPPYLMKTKLK